MECSSADELYASEDELASDSGNSWRFVQGRFCYGSRENKTCYSVRTVSNILINDKVLTRNGCEVLTAGNWRVIKLLSDLLVSSNPCVGEDRFDASPWPLRDAGIGTRMQDRLFSYYYSSEHPALKGYLYQIADIYGNQWEGSDVREAGKTVGFSHDLKSKRLYLIPSSDVCEEERKKRTRDFCL